VSQVRLSEASLKRICHFYVAHPIRQTVSDELPSGRADLERNSLIQQRLQKKFTKQIPDGVWNIRPTVSDKFKLPKP